MNFVFACIHQGLQGDVVLWPKWRMRTEAFGQHVQKRAPKNSAAARVICGREMQPNLEPRDHTKYATATG